MSTAPELANVLGRPAVRVCDLPDWKRRMFQAQLAVWLAGRALTHAVYLNKEYGVPVPGSAVQAFEMARDTWHAWLPYRRSDPARPWPVRRHAVSVDVREDAL